MSDVLNLENWSVSYIQVNIIKGDKAAEDWEYEENAADDDDDMGEQEDVANREASPSPRRYPHSRLTMLGLLHKFSVCPHSLYVSRAGSCCSAQVETLCLWLLLEWASNGLYAHCIFLGGHTGRHHQIAMS